MPIGLAVTFALYAAGLVLSVAPLGRSGWRGTLSWFVSAVPNESPFLVAYLVVASIVLTGRLAPPVWIAAAGMAVVGLLTGPVIVRRSLDAPRAIADALAAGFGPRWVGSRAARALEAKRFPWVRIVLLPLPVLRWALRRHRNVRYAAGGRHHRLDVYRHRRRPLRGPVLIHLHGGHFRTGRKSFEARPILHGLAAAGWLCVSANYRLQPAASYHDQLADAHAVIDWAREHAGALGADPGQVFIAGSSAGANLAIAAGLLAGREVAGAIGLYGYYGPGGDSDLGGPVMPADCVDEQSPPVLIATGTQETLVPLSYTRELISRLRRESRQPVVDIELPGAQHSFDLVHSVRTAALTNAIDAFALACADWSTFSADEMLTR